jgi:MFS family permease
MYKGLFLLRLGKKKEAAEKKGEAKELKLLNSFSFFLGFQSILVVYIMSSFFQAISGLERIESFFIVGYFASFLILINFHYLIKKIGKTNAFLFILAVKSIALFGVAFLSFDLARVFLAIVILALGPIVWVGLDILVESFSQDKFTGEIRGKLLTSMNVGCLLAPFLSAYLVGNTESFRWPFFLAGLIVLNIFLISLVKIPKINYDVQAAKPIKEILKKIMKRKNVSRIYYVSFLMETFYAVMVVYTPLYLLSCGLKWEEIGKIFTIMLLPFIFLQYPVGRLADKKTGEKELLAIGILIMGVFSGLLFFVEGRNVLLWGAILFATRIGAAMIEVLRDSYFYKRIGPADIDIINFYKTARSISYIFALVFFGIISFFLPIRFIFATLSFLIFTGILAIWNLNDNEVYRE